MNHCVVSVKTLFRLKRWDAHHVVECVNLGGDIGKASNLVNIMRNKTGNGLWDLIDEAGTCGMDEEVK